MPLARCVHRTVRHAVTLCAGAASPRGSTRPREAFRFAWRVSDYHTRRQGTLPPSVTKTKENMTNSFFLLSQTKDPPAAVQSPSSPEPSRTARYTKHHPSTFFPEGVIEQLSREFSNKIVLFQQLRAPSTQRSTAHKLSCWLACSDSIVPCVLQSGELTVKKAQAKPMSPKAGGFPSSLQVTIPQHVAAQVLI